MGPPVMTAVMAVTTVASAAMTMMSGRSQRQSYYEQSKLPYERAEKQNQIVDQQNEIDKMRLLRNQRKQMGESIVSGAVSGAGLSNFSELYQEDIEEKALDISIMDYNASLSKYQNNYNAATESYQLQTKGEQAYSQAKGQAVGTLIQGTQTTYSMIRNDKK